MLGKPNKIMKSNKLPMWKGICAYLRCISISSVRFIPSKHPAYTPAICSRRLDPSRLGQLLLSEKIGATYLEGEKTLTSPTPPHLSLAIIPPTPEAQIGVQHLTKRQGGGSASCMLCWFSAPKDSLFGQMTGQNKRLCIFRL